MASQAFAKIYEHTGEIEHRYVLFWTGCSVKLTTRGLYRLQCNKSTALQNSVLSNIYFHEFSERKPLKKSGCVFFTTNSVLWTDEPKFNFWQQKRSVDQCCFWKKKQCISTSLSHPSCEPWGAGSMKGLKLLFSLRVWTVHNDWAISAVQVVAGNSAEKYQGNCELRYAVCLCTGILYIYKRGAGGHLHFVNS